MDDDDDTEGFKVIEPKPKARKMAMKPRPAPKPSMKPKGGKKC